MLRSILLNSNGGYVGNTNFKRKNMSENKEEELYNKYMSFNRIMLEEYDAIEIAAIMTVQALSFYRTVMPEDEYLKMVDSIYENRYNVQTFDGPYIQ